MANFQNDVTPPPPPCLPCTINNSHPTSTRQMLKPYLPCWFMNTESSPWLLQSVWLSCNGAVASSFFFFFFLPIRPVAQWRFSELCGVAWPALQWHQAWHCSLRLSRPRGTLVIQTPQNWTGAVRDRDVMWHDGSLSERKLKCYC